MKLEHQQASDDYKVRDDFFKVSKHSLALFRNLEKSSPLELIMVIVAHIGNTYLVITVPTDALAPNKARPSAGTVLPRSSLYLQMPWHLIRPGHQ